MKLFVTKVEHYFSAWSKQISVLEIIAHDFFHNIFDCLLLIKHLIAFNKDSIVVIKVVFPTSLNFLVMVNAPVLGYNYSEFINCCNFWNSESFFKKLVLRIIRILVSFLLLPLQLSFTNLFIMFFETLSVNLNGRPGTYSPALLRESTLSLSSSIPDIFLFIFLFVLVSFVKARLQDFHKDRGRLGLTAVVGGTFQSSWVVLMLF